MSAPLPLDTILAEFDESAEAWVLQDETSKRYVIIPDDRFPGRRPIRFFMRREDAADLLALLLDANPSLRGKEIYPAKVKLLLALRSIAADRTPDNADAFVVHSPNEVYEYLRDAQE